MGKTATSRRVRRRARCGLSAGELQQALGLDYASLAAIKHDIILSTQTAFGDAGPYRERGV
jgi:hypothetical protein